MDTPIFPPPPTGLAASVKKSLAAAQLEEQDQAAARLAERLAADLEATHTPADVVRIARALHDVLTSLGMTPAARAATTPPALDDDPLAAALGIDLAL